MPRPFTKLGKTAGQYAHALSNNLALMTYRNFSSTRRFIRYGVTYSTGGDDKLPVIQSGSDKYANYMKEFYERTGFSLTDMSGLYPRPEDVEPIDGLNKSVEMAKFEEDEKTPQYLMNPDGSFATDENKKKIPDKVDYYYSPPQQIPVGKAGGLVKTAVETAPQFILDQNFKFSDEYQDDLRGKPGRVSIIFQFYKGRMYNFNQAQLEILYPELKPGNSEIGDDGKPTDAYWARAVKKMQSIHGAKCAERKGQSIKIGGAVNGHIAVGIDVQCGGGKNKFVATELCKPQYLYYNDDFVKPDYSDLKVPSIIYPMHRDSKTGKPGTPQDIKDWDAELIADRYLASGFGQTMGKPDPLKGPINSNGYTVMAISHESEYAGDLAHLSLIMTGEELFNSLLTNPFYSLPSTRLQSAMCETWGTENKYLAGITPEMSLIMSMGETPWDASSARREFTYADPLARILHQVRLSRDSDGDNKKIIQPQFFSKDAVNDFIENIISSRLLLMEIDVLKQHALEDETSGNDIEEMEKELFLLVQRSHNTNQLAGAILTKPELLDMKAIAGDRDVEEIQKICDMIRYSAIRRNMRKLRNTFPDLTIDEVTKELTKQFDEGTKK